MNILGGILWFAMLTPFIIIPLVWHLSDANKIIKMIVGVVLTLIILAAFYNISLWLIFGDGMGPEQ